MSNEADDKEQDDLDIIELDSNQEDGEKNTEEWSVHKSQLDELKELLEKEKQNTNEYVEKWKRALADYQNLNKRSDLDITNKVTNEINKIMLNFLIIYEDLIRANNTLADGQQKFEGINIIIKNMNSIFEEYNIKPIDAVGQTFNPNLHEAVSIVEDNNLDDDTIKEEITKGYISGNNVIKPSKVIVSKKSIKKE
jgi:molecular chaperone GrpE